MLKLILGGLAALLLVASAVLWMLRPGAQRLEGSAAPDFELPDQNGQIHRLGDYAGRWLVLYFYPRDDTPICTQEACRFRDDIGVLGDLDAAVVGVSIDDTQSHADFARKYAIAVSPAVGPRRHNGGGLRQPAESGPCAVCAPPHLHHRAGRPHCGALRQGGSGTACAGGRPFAAGPAGIRSGNTPAIRSVRLEATGRTLAAGLGAPDPHILHA